MRSLLFLAVSWSAPSSSAFPSRPCSNRGESTTRLHEELSSPEETKQALQDILDAVHRLPQSRDRVLERFFRGCGENCRTGPSTVPGAGTGLFAARDIRPGSVLGLYPMHCLELGPGFYENTAVYSSPEDASCIEATESPDYVLTVLGDRPLPGIKLPSWMDPALELYIDVNPNNKQIHPSWLSHYINDGAMLNPNEEDSVVAYYKRSSQRRNCVHVPFGPVPLMASVATKTVPKGEEFFTTYGFEYWSEQVLQDAGWEEEERWYQQLEALGPRIQQQAEEAEDALKQAVGAVEKSYPEVKASLEKAMKTK